MPDHIDRIPPPPGDDQAMRWRSPVSLARLLEVRHQLAFEVCMQLSHGVGEQAEKLVADLLRVEEQVLVLAPRVYARRQASWGRLEAELLHVPGDPRATWCLLCTRVAAGAGMDPGGSW